MFHRRNIRNFTVSPVNYVSFTPFMALLHRHQWLKFSYVVKLLAAFASSTAITHSTTSRRREKRRSYAAMLDAKIYTFHVV